MKAWIAESSDGPLRLTERDVPSLRDGEALVHVAAAGLSPMILKLLRQGRFGHLPTVVGHEIAGTVIRVGGSATSNLIGRRVRVHPMLSCRSCEYCLMDREQLCAQSAMIGAAVHGTPDSLYARYHDGGLAEYVRVPLWLLDPIPDNVSFEVGAKLHDLAIAYRAMRLADVLPGGTLVITAATGAMATACVVLAPHFGVGRVILVGRSRERLRAVEALSPGILVRSIAIEELPDDWESTDALKSRLREVEPAGAHAVIDFLAQGRGGIQALQSLRPGGTLVHMGGNPATVDVPLRVLMNRLWRVVGSRACTRNDVLAVLRLLGSGALNADALITHRWAFVDAERAFEILASRIEPVWMGVVSVSES